ncbi:MAG: fructosamine kinase family protein [Bradymonadaceae bacterium]
MKQRIQRLLTDALDKPVDVHDLRSTAGGDINEASLADTSEGRLFVKYNHSGPADLMEREAEALREMRAGDTSLVIPEPIVAARPDGNSPSILILEYLEPGTEIAGFDERLGRGLAQLHETTAEGFGFHHDNYCGTTPQPNDWQDDWVDFYREKRLRHQLRLAVDHRQVSSSDRRAFDRLLERLDDLLGIDPEPPALIHGDLWSGNLHTAPDGRPSILDPAAYYGHCEAEIGMMELFGGFSETVYAAYQEVRPLQDGWRDRIPLYSLYHVMNHYNLFGGHYGRQAFDIVGRYV